MVRFFIIFHIHRICRAGISQTMKIKDSIEILKGVEFERYINLLLSSIKSFRFDIFIRNNL